MELGLDYITKHVNPYTAPTDTSTWRMLIVDGHSSHIAYPGVEYDLNHGIVVYCLPPHSTHLMQPLDVACFGPLSKACRTALQDFIYENPGRYLESRSSVPSTPLKVANMRSTLSRLTITPNSRAIMDDGLIHLEKKVVHTQVIDPVSQGLKHLRNDKKIKPRSTKQLRWLHIYCTSIIELF